jgi:hypothetical protein
VSGDRRRSREVLRGARHERGARLPNAKRALTVEALRKMAGALDDSARRRRDKALPVLAATVAG